jgi:hypothetical protein
MIKTSSSFFDMRHCERYKAMQIKRGLLKNKSWKDGKELLTELTVLY